MIRNYNQMKPFNQGSRLDGMDEAELQEAVRVIRTVGERMAEQMNVAFPRLQLLERRLQSASQRELPVSTELCREVSRIRQALDEVAADMRRFQEVEAQLVESLSLEDELPTAGADRLRLAA